MINYLEYTKLGTLCHLVKYAYKAGEIKTFNMTKKILRFLYHAIPQHSDNELNSL